MFPWITRTLDGRLYEWAIAMPTIALGIELAIWPGMFEATMLKWVGLVMSPTYLTFLMIAVGAFRVFALFINGRSELIGPVIRAVCAAICAVIWANFSYAMTVKGFERGIPSPGHWFWASFALAEIYVSYRAIMDIKRFTQ